MRSLIALFAAAFAFTGAAQALDAPEAIDGATTVDADAVIELITSTPDLVILDNRRVADYEAGHIEGAVRLLDADIESDADISAHVGDKGDPVLFYCNGLSCGRAANAANKAIEFGYSNVFYYARGIEEWRELGLPLITQ